MTYPETIIALIFLAALVIAVASVPPNDPA